MNLWLCSASRDVISWQRWSWTASDLGTWFSLTKVLQVAVNKHGSILRLTHFQREISFQSSEDKVIIWNCNPSMVVFFQFVVVSRKCECSQMLPCFVRLLRLPWLVGLSWFDTFDAIWDGKSLGRNFLSTLTSVWGWYVSCGLGWLMQIVSLRCLMGPEGTSASVAHRWSPSSSSSSSTRTYIDVITGKTQQQSY